MNTKKICSLGLGISGTVCLLVSCNPNRNQLSQTEFYEAKGIVVAPSTNYPKKQNYSNQWAEPQYNSDTGSDRLVNQARVDSPVEPVIDPSPRFALTNPNPLFGGQPNTEKKTPASLITAGKPRIGRPLDRRISAPPVVVEKKAPSKPSDLEPQIKTPKPLFASKPKQEKNVEKTVSMPPVSPQTPPSLAVANPRVPIFGNKTKAERAASRKAKVSLKKGTTRELVQAGKIEKAPVVPKTSPPVQRKEILVASNETIQMINANGEDVKITGRGGVIIIRGGCRMLTITGNNNKVTCEDVLRTSISGSDNTVGMRSISSGEVSGNGNEINWNTVRGNGAPNLKLTGSNNSASRLR